MCIVVSLCGCRGGGVRVGPALRARRSAPPTARRASRRAPLRLRPRLGLRPAPPRRRHRRPRLRRAQRGRLPARPAARVSTALTHTHT